MYSCRTAGRKTNLQGQGVSLPDRLYAFDVDNALRKSYIEQLNLILQTLGMPDDETLMRIGSEKASSSIRGGDESPLIIHRSGLRVHSNIAPLRESAFRSFVPQC